jgi:hypothetical protein
VNDDAETDRIFSRPVGLEPADPLAETQIKYISLYGLPNAYRLFETSLGKKDHEHQDRRQNPLYRY